MLDQVFGKFGKFRDKHAEWDERLSIHPLEDGEIFHVHNPYHPEYYICSTEKSEGILDIPQLQARFATGEEMSRDDKLAIFLANLSGSWGRAGVGIWLLGWADSFLF